MSGRRLLLVALGGGVGSALRYAVALAAERAFGTGLPLGTFLVNAFGSFAIGLVAGLAATGTVGPDARLLLATGFLGGLTTYSAFSYETVALLGRGAWGVAILNVVVTTAACVLLAGLGLAAARALPWPR